MNKIGIIGHGSFGKFAATVLAPHGDIFVYDKTHPAQITHGKIITFDALADMDCILLAIPLDAYESTLRQLRPILRAETLVVDICSVKVRSRDIVRAELVEHPNMLICHPLFGPQSAADGVSGHQLIVTNVIGDNAKQAVQFCEDTLGLKTIHMSAEEHDLAMAQMHVLTFFVARGLRNLALADMPFEIPSFRLVRQLIDFDQSQSDELFTTIQQGNPYGEKVRHDLVQTFSKLEQSLKRSVSL